MKTPPFVSAALILGLAVVSLANPVEVRAQLPSPSPGDPAASPSPRDPVHAAKITVLSTMMTDRAGFGEWGFSALVEADGKRVLFDTGGRPETVLTNARELGVDLSGVEDVILSHNHWDHTMGLVTLRRELMKVNPKALSRAHVGRGIFLERVFPAGWGSGQPLNMAEIRRDYEALGGTFVEYAEPRELFAGAWLTGPVPRPYPEKNWSPGVKLRPATAGQPLVDDTLPEDQSLVLDTDQGLVVLTGCGHAGVINTLEYARKSVRPAPVLALLGGMHLFAAKGETLDWTAGKLKEFNVAQIMGAHCTGIQPVFYFRERLGLDRKACVVGAVGSSFELGKGFNPGLIAQ